jgi:hypothetical protein
VLISAMVLFVVLLGLGVWRLQSVEQARRDALRGVVEAESLALRLGNRFQFMQLQGRGDAWQKKQRSRFDQFQRYGEEVVVTGDIVEMKIAGDEAEVTVRLTVNGEEDKAVWLYDYTDFGWLHVATTVEPWTLRSIDAGDVTVEYAGPDRALAEYVAVLMRDWWARARGRTGVETPLEVVIELDADSDKLFWEESAELRVNVPSRTASGEPLLTLDASTRETLLLMLAARWTEHALGGRDFRGYDVWVEEEVDQLLRSEFDVSSPVPPILGQLIRVFGPDFVPAFLSELRSGNQGVVASMHNAMSASAPQNLEGDELIRYLTAYLNAEITLGDQEEDATGFSDRTNALFITSHDAHGSTVGQVSLSALPMMRGPVTVLDVQGQEGDDLLWARVAFPYEETGWDGVSYVGPRMVYIPFMFIDGFWKHTRASGNDWGSTVRTVGTYLSFETTELDAAYQTAFFRSALQDQYARVTADFGLAEPPQAMLHIYPYVSDFSNFEYFDGSDIHPVIHAQALSLYASCCMRMDVTPADALYESASQSLIAETYYYVRGGDVPALPFDSAILAWEGERQGIASDVVGFDDEKLERDTNVPRTMDGLWANDVWFDRAGYYDAVARRIGAYALIDVLVEKYGIEVLPKLIDALPDVRETFTDMTIDDWLTAAGIARGEVEADWLARYDTLLLARGFIPEP